jgi:hypothetical protein
MQRMKNCFIKHMSTLALGTFGSMQRVKNCFIKHMGTFCFGTGNVWLDAESEKLLYQTHEYVGTGNVWLDAESENCFIKHMGTFVLRTRTQTQFLGTLDSFAHVATIFIGQSHPGVHVWFGHGFMFGVHVEALPRPLFELVC